jgi:hypothetical protein
MKQRNNTLEMMGILVIVTSALLFFLFINFFTSFCKDLDNSRYLKSKPVAFVKYYSAVNQELFTSVGKHKISIRQLKQKKLKQLL